MQGLSINQLEVGQTEAVTKTISESDVYQFAGITGDLNPAHVNEIYAQDSMFKGRIAHGILTAGLISAVIGTRLPGPGTIYMKQDLKFTAPVRIGDTITATVTVEEMNVEKNRVVLHTVCENQKKETVIDGSALVMPPVA